MPSPASQNALVILRQDHRRLKDLFLAFEDSEDLSEQQDILNTVVKELTTHVALEGRLFLPAVKGTPWAGPLVVQAEEAHEDMQTVLSDLQDMDVEDPLFADKFVELEDKVLEHVKETEEELLYQAEHADYDWDELGKSMQTLKEKLSKDRS
jgi:hypothetical protein